MAIRSESGFRYFCKKGFKGSAFTGQGYIKKGSEVPLHSHKEHQVGYVIKGKLKFATSDHEFIAEAGDSYIFDSNEMHGASILEDSEVIDVFTPSREDYK